MMDINQKFGIIVKKLREQKGLSQEKFAEIAEIHRTYVSSIESGKVNISLKIACKLANAFGMTLSKLLEYTNNI